MKIFYLICVKTFTSVQTHTFISDDKLNLFPLVRRTPVPNRFTNLQGVALGIRRHW